MKRHLTRISCEISMDLSNDDIHCALHLGCLLRRTSEVKSRIKVYSDSGVYRGVGGGGWGVGGGRWGVGGGGGNPLLAPSDSLSVCQGFATGTKIRNNPHHLNILDNKTMLLLSFFLQYCKVAKPGLCLIF